MSDCCASEIASARRVLWIVLALNFSMFLLEVWQGLLADSTSLLADSMDFLSDSFSYLITLYVLQRSLRVRAAASFLKAALMLMLAAGALVQGGYNLIEHQTPHYVTMGWVGALALIANIAIICAAWLVYATGSLWPDLVVALVIAGLEGGSALHIIAEAKKEWRHGDS